MVADVNIPDTKPKTVSIELSGNITPEQIKRLMDALDTLVEGSEVNRAAWNQLVDALEDVEDLAAIREWKADGSPTVPFEQVLHEMGTSIEEAKRGV